MNAIKNQRDEAFAFLKDLDVDSKVFHINRMRDGKTALHLAVQLAYKPALDFFLTLPIATKLLNEEDEQGETPLHLAARSGNRDLIFQLKNAGADVEKKNKKEQTAADLAEKESLKKLLSASTPTV